MVSSKTLIDVRETLADWDEDWENLRTAPDLFVRRKGSKDRWYYSRSYKREVGLE